MIPIYWINLDESVDRRNTMISQCKQYNLVNKRVQAIRHERPTVGCCLSHLKAIHTAWLEENDMAIICEDDIDLSRGKDIYKLIQNILDSMPENIKNSWDIIQLQYTDPTLTKVLNKYLETTNYKENNKLIHGYLMGAVGYLINRKGMNRLLNQMTKIDTNDFGKYIVTANFDHPKAISEELIYCYVNSYLSIFPVFTYLDSKSTINDDDVYLLVNRLNKANVSKIISMLKPDCYKLNHKNIYMLDKDFHWFANDDDKAEKFINELFI